MPDTHASDPLGWIDALRDALADPALAGFDRPGEAMEPETRRAAYRLALSLGYCRLFGAQPPEDLDGTLPAPESMAAAEQLREFVADWTRDAGEVEARWDESEPEVGEALCADLLEARMDAWAVFTAISEAHEDSAARGEAGLPQFDAAMDLLLAALDSFDEALEKPQVLALLSTLVGMPLLDNWRGLLSEPYRSVLPWWLDGTLEAMARRIDREVLATVPGAEAWRRARERRMPMAARARRWNEVLLSLPAPIGMAAKGKQSTLPSFLAGHWRSPDGRYQAMLRAPAKPVAGQLLQLTVVRTDDGGNATDLTGTSVRLGGIEQRLDTSARAAFPLEQWLESLRQPNPDTSLAVGPERIVWEELL